jgi:purine-binding chemotaxis protein CheW
MNRYLSFQVADLRLAVGLPLVRQVLRFENVTAVPQAPRPVEGILNLGGEVVPVINLRARLGLPRLEPCARHRVLIAERAGGKYGLLVDRVREIFELEETSIAPPVAGLPGLKAEILEGMAKVGEVLLCILDLSRLLAAESPAVE